MIVCGANTSLTELRNVELEVPKKAGGFWKGVKHSTLVECILGDLIGRGWKVLDMKFALSKDKADLAAGFELEIPDLPDLPGQRYSLGMLTSNALRRPIKLTSGTRIMCCNNGMCTGDILLNQRHTKKMDLAAGLESAIGEFHERCGEIPALVEGYRNRELVANEADHILMELGRAGTMSWAKVGVVDEQFRNPPYEDHGTGTSWTMLNAFTEVVKQYNPLRQMDMITEFRQQLPIATAV